MPSSKDAWINQILDSLIIDESKHYVTDQYYTACYSPYPKVDKISGCQNLNNCLPVLDTKIAHVL